MGSAGRVLREHQFASIVVLTEHQHPLSRLPFRQDRERVRVRGSTNSPR
jgi:hypothetical protein